MSPRRLVIMVEGKGDLQAVPVLVNRLLDDAGTTECFYIGQVMTVGGLEALTGKRAPKWLNYLRAASKYRDLGAVLLLLDGDHDLVINDATGAKEPFCAARVARRLVHAARAAGAGNHFSLACVFAMREFESWLACAAEQLRGLPLPDGRAGVHPNAMLPGDDPERTGKGWFQKHMLRGYVETRDQVLLTRMVSIDAIRSRGSRSFVRLENALKLLCEAGRQDRHVVSPE